LGLFREPRDAKVASDDNGLVDGLMQLLIELRAEARKTKNFALGDRIRNGLSALQVSLTDRADKTEWSIDK